MVDDYIPNKTDKIKDIIGTEKFNDTKILIDTDDKLPDDITFKKFVMLNKDIKKKEIHFFIDIKIV